MSFPRYEKYKDSGVEWLGEIPTHWSTSPCSALAVQIQTGPFGSQLHSEEYLEDQTPVINPSNIGDGTLIPDWSCSVGPEVVERLAQHKLKVGDIVVGRRGEMGRCGLVDEASEGWLCGTGSLRLRMSPKMLPEFASAFLRTDYSRERLKLESVGSTMDNLNGRILGRVQIPFPSVAEQLSIVRYLSAGVAKIDALVEEQKRLIELLKEKRQAVISQAVTKGLDPNVPMKESGVEWLGKVPAHWKVLRVKDVARLESGHTPSKTVPEYWENCTIPWVSLNDSKQLAVLDYITETAFQINELGLANSSARMLPTGAVVFTRDATIGLAAITTRPMAVSQHLIAWCPSEDIDALYLLRVFDVMKRFLDSTTFGATIKTIGMADVKKLVTPVPPRAEQLQIAAAVDRNINSIDALVRDAELSVDLLRERRAALISAAVTGKIDVRSQVSQSEALAA